MFGGNHRQAFKAGITKSADACGESFLPKAPQQKAQVSPLKNPPAQVSPLDRKLVIVRCTRPSAASQALLKRLTGLPTAGRRLPNYRRKAATPLSGSASGILCGDRRSTPAAKAISWIRV
jgi:hypothetical protein